MVYVEVFGAVKVNHAPVGDSPQAEAMITLLALAREGKVPLDRLKSVCWPDSSDKVGMPTPLPTAAMLRTAVSRVRTKHLKLSDKALVLHYDDSAHAAQEPGLYLEPGVLTSDVAHFDSLVATPAERQSQNGVRIEALTQAVVLYERGLLPHRLEILESERVSLFSRWCDAVLELWHHAGIGHVVSVEAVEAHSLWMVQSYPKNWRCTHHRMRLLEARNELPSAMAAYEALEDRLSSGDRAGLPQTFRAYAQALRARLPGPSRLGASVPALAGPSFRPPSESAERIEEILAGGPIRMFCLAGLPEVGKSYCAIAMAQQLVQERRCHVGYVPCGHESDGKSCFRDLTELLGGASERQVDEVDGAALALKRLLNVPPRSGGRAVFDPKKCVLFIDGADSLSTEELRCYRALAGHVSGLRLVFVARRPPEADDIRIWRVVPLEPEPARKLLDYLRGLRAASVPGVDLAPESLRSLIPEDPDLAWLLERTGGIPGRIRVLAGCLRTAPPSEICRRLRYQGKAFPDEEQFLQAAVTGLSDRARLLLPALSTFHHGFHPDMVAAVTGIADVHELVEELVATSLVEDRMDGGRQRFFLTRAIVSYADRSLSDSVKNDLVVKKIQAFVEFVRGRKTLAPGEFDERMFQERWELRACLAWTKLRKEYYTSRPPLAWAAAQGLAAYQRYEEALTLVEEVVAEEHLGEDALWCVFFVGLCLAASGRPTKAIAALEPLLGTSELGEFTGFAANVRNVLGNLFQDQGEYAKSEAALRQSIVWWDRLGEPEAAAQSRMNLANTLRLAGNVCESLPLYMEAFEAVRDTHCPPLKAHLLDNRGSALLDAGELDRAEADLRLCLKYMDYIEETGPHTRFKRTRGFVYHNLGRLEMRQGNWTQARQWLGQSQEIRERLDDPLSLANTFLLLAELSLTQHRVIEAAENLHRAVVLALSEEMVPVALDCLLVGARLAEAAGEWDRAIVLAVAESHFRAVHDILPTPDSDREQTPEAIRSRLRAEVGTVRYASAREHAEHYTLTEILMEMLPSPEVERSHI